MERQTAPAAQDAPDPGRAASGPRLFTIRLWQEKVNGGQEYRGTVCEVVTGAFRSFRNWPDLAEFMIERMSDDQAGRMGAARARDQLGRNEAE